MFLSRRCNLYPDFDAVGIGAFLAVTADILWVK